MSIYNYHFFDKQLAAEGATLTVKISIDSIRESQKL